MATTTRVLDANVNGTVYTSNANGALEAIDTCHSGATAPTDEVANGKLWLDTTTTPGILKVYNNAAWEVVHSGTADINGGTIDGTVIGGAAAAAGTFTALTSNGIDDNAAATAVTIDASGNVGIGGAASAWSVISPVLSVDNASLGSYSAGTQRFSYLWNNLYFNGTNNVYQATGKGAMFAMDQDQFKWLNAPSGTGGTAATLTERMRIESSGSIVLGPGPGAVSSVQVIPNYSNGAALLYWNRYTTAATSTALRFDNQGVARGSITYNNTSTSYNTSSDYRLKEAWVPMTGASERVQALKPINFAWKADGSRVDGFLAHELAEVVPEAATGTKDAMMDEEYEVTPAVEATLDAEGVELTPAVEAVMGTRSVPDMQGIDQSKLVPLLTAALQEALTKIEALEAQNAAFETRLAALEP